MSNQNDYEHFISMLEGFDTAMLVTEGLQGKLIARPMAVAGIDSNDHSLYFFSGVNTQKVQEIADDSRVVLAFSSGWKMLSLSGLASITKDSSKIDEYWKENYRSWFPDGKDDRNLCLIRVEPLEGEFWDTGGFEAIKYIFNKTKAILTGSTMKQEEEGAHGQVRL